MPQSDAVDIPDIRSEHLGADRRPNNLGAHLKRPNDGTHPVPDGRPDRSPEPRAVAVTDGPPDRGPDHVAADRDPDHGASIRSAVAYLVIV